MQQAVPVGTGAMAALLGLSLEDAAAAAAEAAQGEVCDVANDNGGGQVVVSGKTSAVERAVEIAKGKGAKRAMMLKVSAPFHCALMKPAEDRLAPELRALASHDPSFPVVANVDAAPKTTAADAIEALVRQVSSPVRWEDVVRRLITDGVTTFVEVGPGSVLAGLIKKIDRGVTVFSVDDETSLIAMEAALKI